MLFTTGQLRSTFALSKQQWRSYREFLPPATKENVRSPCFSAGDLLAISVVRRLSGSLSSPLSAFTPIAERLFELCSKYPWPQLERSYLLLDLETPFVELVDGDLRATGTKVGLLVQLSPLVVELREQLLADNPDTQRDLAFPPMLAGTRR